MGQGDKRQGRTARVLCLAAEEEGVQASQLSRRLSRVPVASLEVEGIVPGISCVLLGRLEIG